MKKLLLLVGIIPTVGSAIYSMGNLTYEKAFSYGFILLFSFLFILGMIFLYRFFSGTPKHNRR